MRTTYNYSRIFRNRQRAEAFARSLQEQGRPADIWQGLDGFGQLEYIVKWD